MSATNPIKIVFFSILMMIIMLMTNTVIADEKEEKQAEENTEKTEEVDAKDKKMDESETKDEKEEQEKDDSNKTPEQSNNEELKVKITDSIPFLEVNHHGKLVRIQRVQDIDFKVTNSFARTSRKCPPFCIRPIKLPGDIETVGELELLQFLKDKVRTDKGILVDARLKDWHIKGTIPGSVSIPFTMFIGGLQDINTVKLLELLGAKEEDDNKWIFDEAIELMLFCNGPWCGQSEKAIKNLLKIGYPAEKIYWYRGGMQAWQSFGLTTIKP